MSLMAMPQCWKDKLAECCGSGSGNDFPCETLDFYNIPGDPLSGLSSLCATFGGCGALDGVQVTVPQSGSHPCFFWSGISGTISCDNGCAFVVNPISVTCGYGADADCATMGVDSSSSFATFAVNVDCPGGSAELVFVRSPGADPSIDVNTHLPITWVNASPPVGIARGYAVYRTFPPGGDTTDAQACLCATDSPVDILIAKGAC